MIKKQILLPREAFALGNDADTFLNIQLSRSETDIKTEKIDNIFSVSGQIEKERQASLKFCVFGLVDSKYADCGNIIIDIKDSQGLTLFLPKISSDAIAQTHISVKTFELTEGSNMSCNLYGKKKAAYSIIFEISRTELDALNVEIIKVGSLPKTHTIDISVVDIEKNIYHLQSIPYLFYDLEGNQVPFGSQTSDLDIDGNTIEINNDFAFLYDRHWIRSLVDLPAPSNVTFTTDKINVAENIGEVFVTLSLDQKSIYGIEEVSVVVSADNTIRNPNTDYVFETQRVRWSAGEQEKTINILDVVDDKFVEDTESLEISIADISGCVLQPDGFSKVKISITNEDYPSEIKFSVQDISVKSDVGSVIINFEFHKPLEVSNQSIVLYATSKSTALINTDFSFSPENRNLSEITIDFEEGDTGGSAILYIFDNIVYDLNKLVQIGFRNPTQNISISTVGALTDGQVININIEDSINTLWATFITVNNSTNNVGPLKTLKGPDIAGRYRWSLDAEKGFVELSSNYEITVRNAGDRILYNGKLIPPNGIVETITYSVRPTSDLKYDFPSNASYSSSLKAYTKAKYSFEYKCKDRFSIPYSSSFTNQYDFRPIQVFAEKDAGPQGSKKYYFTARLNYFITNYNSTNNSCDLTIDNKVYVAVFTNCVPFAGFNIYGGVSQVQSFTEATFESSTVVSHCTQFLPFGFTQLPNPPYDSQYITINFRNFYPQSTGPIEQPNSLRLDQVNDQPKIGFVTLANTTNDTRNAMMVSVRNNGAVAVTISGSTIEPNQSFIIRGYEADFNSLSVLLPGNESYNALVSKFLVCNYIISVDNVRYFVNGQPVGDPMSYVFESTNTLITGPQDSVPLYNIITEYSNINVPHQGTQTDSAVDCSSSIFDVTKLHPITVGIRGILLPNSLTTLKRAYFLPTTNDLGLSCISETSTRIPFTKL